MDVDLVVACERLAAGVGGAIAAKPLLERLLGPSFDYVGRAMADLLARYGNANVTEIFRRAASRMDAGMDNRTVHPRVLKTIIEEGSFVEDAVTQEYFAGLLASSVAVEPTDEAVVFLSCVKALTASQIRLHHAFYSLQRQLQASAPLAPLFIPDHYLEREVCLTSRRATAMGLVRANLIDDSSYTSKYLWVAAEGGGYTGMLLAGTPLGAELFLWVHGAPRSTVRDFAAAELRGWVAPPSVGNGFATNEAIARMSKAIPPLRNAVTACRTRKSPQEIRTAVRKLVLSAADMLPITKAERRRLAGYSVARFDLTIEELHEKLSRCLLLFAPLEYGHVPRWLSPWPYDG